MLKVKRLKKYNRAKYPCGVYYKKNEDIINKMIVSGLASLSIIALLESCGNRSTDGIGPAPDVVTESEARIIINKVFADSGISLNQDVKYLLRYGNNDSTELVLDGYNDSLKVGYEYIANNTNDIGTFNKEVLDILNETMNDSGPYVKAIDGRYKYDDYQIKLENLIREFIHSLKTQGII